MTRLVGLEAVDEVNLVVIRGLPGAGKSTLARSLKPLGFVHVEADFYF